MPRDDPRAIVLYDEDCGFCRWTLAKVLAWDRAGRLRPEPIQGPEGDRLLAGMPESDRLASWHLVGPDGTLRSGGAALPALLSMLPRGQRLAGLAERAPRLLDRGYRWVAGHRTLLGKPVTIGARRRADAAVARRRASAG
jgi:predicted DCC family thiol-disulfide oxidoreductase YuxK